MKHLIILGASGSVGTQTLEVIRAYPDLFKLKALSVGRRDGDLELLIEEFNLEAVCLFNEDRIKELRIKYPHLKVYGKEDLCKLIESVEADIMVNAIVGIAGLEPTVTAVKQGIDIALANKETLVTGGDLIMDLIQDNDVKIFPIDSEHSAIWQVLLGNDTKEVNTITLTASGGSFRNLSRDELKNVSKQDALNHPNWSMGEKITIDSATLMNKGLEVIEAHYLFDLDYDRIKVLIHHQSVIHSYVEFNDKSILAQMGTASMILPIQFALTYPNHLPIENSESLDLVKLKELTFTELCFERYPLVKLAYEVGIKKGNKPIIMNAANEAAVSLFLKEKIDFLDIETLVITSTKEIKYSSVNSFDEIYLIHQKVFNTVMNSYHEILEGVYTW